MAARSPNFNGFSRWALEVTLIDAAAFYTYGGDEYESVLSDAQFDALAVWLCSRPKFVSPYFRHGVNMKLMKATTSATAINWRGGIGNAALRYWKLGEYAEPDEPEKPITVSRIKPLRRVKPLR